jgi:hypothetical protein
MHVIESATPSGKNPLKLISAGLDADQGHASGEAASAGPETESRCRLRRLSDRAAAVCCVRHVSDRDPRAECRDGPRQPDAVAPGDGDCRRFHEGGRRACRQNRRDRQSGAPCRDRGKNSISTHRKTMVRCGWWSLAAARARASFPIRCRRRSRFAGRIAEPIEIVQQARPEDEARVKARYGELGVEAEVSPFFATCRRGSPQRIS